MDCDQDRGRKVDCSIFPHNFRISRPVSSHQLLEHSCGSSSPASCSYRTGTSPSSHLSKQSYRSPLLSYFPHRCPGLASEQHSLHSPLPQGSLEESSWTHTSGKSGGSQKPSDRHRGISRAPPQPPSW